MRPLLLPSWVGLSPHFQNPCLLGRVGCHSWQQVLWEELESSATLPFSAWGSLPSPWASSVRCCVWWVLMANPPAGARPAVLRALGHALMESALRLAGSWLSGTVALAGSRLLLGPGGWRVLVP